VKALDEGVHGDVSTARLAHLPLTAELLPGWHDKWVEAERRRYRQFRLHALEAISSRLIDERRYGTAIEIALAAIASEPLRASARRVLIQTHLAEGNRGEAVREYDHYSRLLRRRLGVDPPVDLALLVGSGPSL
jgi:DNA-binding SARP family transcriptional activator